MTQDHNYNELKLPVQIIYMNKAKRSLYKTYFDLVEMNLVKGHDCFNFYRLHNIIFHYFIQLCDLRIKEDNKILIN